MRSCSDTVLLGKSGMLTALLCNGKREGRKDVKVRQCHQNQENCRKVLSSLVQLLTELSLNLWGNTEMPYEPIPSSISMWAAADMPASNSQESLKALGQQLSCFTNENRKSRHTRQHRWPQKTNIYIYASQTLLRRSYPDRVS